MGIEELKTENTTRVSRLSRPKAAVLSFLMVIAGFGAFTGVATLSEASTSGAVVTATFVTTSAWSGGYTGVFTMRNTGTTAVNGWNLVFTLPAGNTLVNSWNGTTTQNLSVVTASNATWNGSLPAGGSQTFGLQIANGGPQVAVTNCTINGLANCVIPGTTAPPTTTTTAPPTTTTTAPPTTTTIISPPGGKVTAAMTSSSTWTGGYTASVNVSNRGTTTVNTWSFQFAVPTGGTLSSLWSGTERVSGSSVTVTPVSWNGTLVPGASATFGFEIDNTNVYPTSCSINDSTSGCSVPAPAPNPMTPKCTTLPSGAGPTQYAPYADVTLYPEISLTNTACATGITSFSLAFFQGPPSGTACTPELAGSSFQNPVLLADIKSLRALGGDVIGSFGGAAGQELAQVCTTPSQLESAYQSVVDYYGLTQVDFDVEGAAVGDTVSVNLRSAALASLQAKEAAAGHPITISLTLPVLPQGLPQAELAVIQSSVKAGVTLSVVNVMAMDYGDGPAPNPSGKMGTYAIDAGKSTEAQLAVIFPKATTAQLWAMVGVTPMVGLNDLTTEIFTTADATTLANWAKTQGIGRLAMWSISRDAPCPGNAVVGSNTCSGTSQTPYQFSQILKAG